MVRDFTPFSEALAAYNVEDAAVLEELVSGKNIPELQALMESGELIGKIVLSLSPPAP